MIKSTNYFHFIQSLKGTGVDFHLDFIASETLLFLLIYSGYLYRYKKNIKLYEYHNFFRNIKDLYQHIFVTKRPRNEIRPLIIYFRCFDLNFIVIFLPNLHRNNIINYKLTA